LILLPVYCEFEAVRAPATKKSLEPQEIAAFAISASVLLIVILHTIGNGTNNIANLLLHRF